MNQNNSLAPLVFAIDKGFILPLVNALRSLAKVYVESDPLEVYVIHSDEFEIGDVTKLQDALAERPNISLTLHRVDRFSDQPNSEINHGAYLRLAIPTIFADYKKVVYLDADIMFVKSPHELAQFTPEPKYIIAACQDVQNPTLGSGIALPGWEKLNLAASQSYFNSGVMVINPQAWQKAKVTERTIDFVQSHPEHLRFRDQDALNYLLRDQWQQLPLKWNYPPLSAILKVPGAKYYAEANFPLSEMLDGEQSAAIFHFVGPNKPWNDDFPTGPITDLYRQYTL